MFFFFFFFCDATRSLFPLKKNTRSVIFCARTLVFAKRSSFSNRKCMSSLPFPSPTRVYIQDKIPAVHPTHPRGISFLHRYPQTYQHARVGRHGSRGASARRGLLCGPGRSRSPHLHCCRHFSCVVLCVFVLLLLWIDALLPLVSLGVRLRAEGKREKDSQPQALAYPTHSSLTATQHADSLRVTTREFERYIPQKTIHFRKFWVYGKLKYPPSTKPVLT